MAEHSGRRSDGFLYFMIGALVVAVAVIAWLAFAGGGQDSASLSITVPDSAAIEAPAANPAGDPAP